MKPETYKNIAIVPIIALANGAFQYLTVGEALAAQKIAITETSTAGSVPELMVINRGNKPVLLVDGEELAGAKQNRVLNTSILLKEASETKIPVSCTEQGRWAYSSGSFSESGNVMAYKSRARKSTFRPLIPGVFRRPLLQPGRSLAWHRRTPSQSLCQFSHLRHARRLHSPPGRTGQMQ